MNGERKKHIKIVYFKGGSPVFLFFLACSKNNWEMVLVEVPLIWEYISLHCLTSTRCAKHKATIWSLSKLPTSLENILVKN